MKFREGEPVQGNDECGFRLNERREGQCEEASKRLETQENWTQGGEI